MLQSLSGSIDAVWVGRFMGEDALAATLNRQRRHVPAAGLRVRFGMASTILIGQAYGRGDEWEVRRIVGTALGTFAPAAVVLSGLGWAFAPQPLDALGTPPEAVAQARA